MKKYRIKFEDGKYYPQVKGWIFWNYISDGYGRSKYFPSLLSARDHIKCIKNSVKPKIKYYYDC